MAVTCDLVGMKFKDKLKMLIKQNFKHGKNKNIQTFTQMSPCNRQCFKCFKLT